MARFKQLSHLFTDLPPASTAVTLIRITGRVHYRHTRGLWVQVTMPTKINIIFQALCLLTAKVTTNKSLADAFTFPQVKLSSASHCSTSVSACEEPRLLSTMSTLSCTAVFAVTTETLTVFFVMFNWIQTQETILNYWNFCCQKTTFQPTAFRFIAFTFLHTFSCL